MSITVVETPRSQGASLDPKGATLTLDFWARSTFIDDTPDNICAAVLSVASPIYLGLIRKSIKPDPSGGGFWTVKVEYGTLEGGAMIDQTGDQKADVPEFKGLDTLKPEISFSTSGGTQHITQSFETKEKQARAGLIAPDNQRAIGATREHVDGCDIVVPKFEFSITKRPATINWDYAYGLMTLTGRTNFRKWGVFERGELLYLGCDGKFDGDGITDFSWLLTHKFAFSRNRSGITICDGLIVASKRGHDYLWVGFAEAADAAAAVTIQRPSYAYVERVYEERNFRSYLGF